MHGLPRLHAPDIVPCIAFLYYTLTHPFNGPFSGTTRVSRYQKGKTNLDFTEARDSEWQWHQLVHIQVCISLQTDNHAWRYCGISFDYDDHRKFLYFYLCNLTPKILIWNKYASTPPLQFFTGRMPFMPPNQQRKSTEGVAFLYYYYYNHLVASFPGQPG